jgi:hypothetical protein
MSKLGRISAALGSVALNVVLTLILSSGAGAMAQTKEESRPAPENHVVLQNDTQDAANFGCVFRFRNRAIAALVLALMV